MTIRISWFVFLFVILSGNAVFAADDLHEKILACTSKSHDLIKGYKLDDNEEEISVFLCDGTVVNPDKAEGQVAISSPQISKDRKTIGWAVNVLNCCTSYPVPTFLNIYQNDSIYIVNANGQMVWNWRFSKKGKVIIEEGTVHGMNEPNINEYDIETGKRLKHIKDGK